MTPPQKNGPFPIWNIWDSVALTIREKERKGKKEKRKERVGEDKCRKEGTEKREGKEVEFKNRIQKFRKDQSTKKKKI